MARYAMMHQYEPLYAPTNWETDGQRFVNRLTAILDDIYRRYGRLTQKDLGDELNHQLKDFDSKLTTMHGSNGALNEMVFQMQTKLNDLTNRVDQLDGREPVPLKQADGLYPVGSLYLSATEDPPETLLGGKWSKIEDRLLLCAGTKFPIGTEITASAVQAAPGNASALPPALSVSVYQRIS